MHRDGEAAGRAGLLHRFQYVLFLTAAWAIRRLPERAALGLGSALGGLTGSLFRVRRAVVEENLATAFPDAPKSWRRGVATASYRHLGRETAALVRLQELERSDLRERVHFEGMEHVRKAVEAGTGLIILTGHLGNWEIGGAGIAAHGIGLDVVARRQSNPLIDARLERTRERLGMRVVYRSEDTRQILRALRKGGVVAMVADQNVRRGGVFVDFFGVSAATARGPGLLAHRTGASAVVGVVYCSPGSEARYRIRFVPVVVDRTGDADRDLRAFARAYLEVLEEGIRAAPAQYFWFHRRWKTRPEDQEPRIESAVPEEPAEFDEPGGTP